MLQLEHGYRVVDVHTRLDPMGTAKTTDGYGGEPDRLEREMLQAGIIKAAVFPATDTEVDDGYLAANNAVARHTVDRPFLALARLGGPIEPGARLRSRLRTIATRDETHTTPTDVEQYAIDERFHGFVLHPAVDGLPDEEVLDALASVDRPVLVHTAPTFPPAAIKEVLLDRNITVIIGHLGGRTVDFNPANAAIDLLSESQRCYLETALIRDRAALERALLEHPDRVCFGSGAPTVHPNVAMMEVMTLDVSEDKIRRVFSSNVGAVIEGMAPG